MTTVRLALGLTLSAAWLRIRHAEAWRDLVETSRQLNRDQARARTR